MTSKADIDQREKKMRMEADLKVINPTLLCLANLTQSASFTINSVFPSINGVKCTVLKSDDEFIFETDNLNICKGFLDLKVIQYGFSHEFQLKNDAFEFKIPQFSATITSQKIFQDYATSGRIPEFKNNFIENETFNRIVFTREFNPYHNYSEYLKTIKFKTENEDLYLKGLSKLNVNGLGIDIFEFENNKIQYLFIDCRTPIRFDFFEEYANAIAYSFGFLSGYLQRDEFFCFQSGKSDYSNIAGCCYKKLEPTIDSGMMLISPRDVKSINPQYGEAAKMKISIFSNLVTQAVKEKRMLRALRIISESNAYPLEIRASAYSVALETVRNIIAEENIERMSPFKNKDLARELKKQFTATVADCSNDDFNNKQVVLKRINDLDQITNKDSLMLAFSLYGFNLTKEDINCIEKRNDFLHGRLPFENETNSESEIKYFTHKLHFLVSSLILKYCGYYGWVLNSHKYLELFDPKYEKHVEESTFRTI